MAFVFGAVAVFVLFVILEGLRQERKYGRSSGSPNLAAVGLLELQKHLQADRRVEVMVQRAKAEDGEVDTQEQGDGNPTGVTRMRDLRSR